MILKRLWRGWRLRRMVKKAETRVVSLYKQKGETVVCHYCGKLMSKEDAKVVAYDPVADCLEFWHQECFDEFKAGCLSGQGGGGSR